MLYKTIKSEPQYKAYKSYLEKQHVHTDQSEDDLRAIDRLNFFIHEWERKHNKAADDPQQPASGFIGRLLLLMKKKNIQASELASATHVSQTFLSDILNGKCEITREILKKLSDRLGGELNYGQ